MAKTVSLAETIAVEPLTLADLDRGLSVPERFASIVRAYGDRPAVTTRTETITYADLDRMANRLAHRLLEHGEAQSRIALLMEPRIAMYAALLGTLKAGRTAIVLNPDDPPERLRQLCDYAGISAILVDDQTAALATAAMGESVPSLRLDEVSVGGKSSDPSLPITIQDPSLLVYTSGSTGRPKGVLKSHGSILRVALSASADDMRFTAGDRIVATTAPWGSQAMNTAFSVLLNGATLMPFPAARRGVTGLSEWLTESDATVFMTSSSLCRHFLKTLGEGTTFPGIRLARVGADAATWDDISALWHRFPNAEVLTSLGATETSTIALKAFSPGCDRLTAKPPVGRPTTGLSVRIVDEQGRDCAPGVIGTVEVRSRFLALGYWRDPELTKRTFSDEPDGTRVFHSSDRAYFTDDGAIVLEGRRDTVVKIRGYSVNLGEVEDAVAKIPGIGEAAAVVTERTGDEPFLLAYVSPLPGLSITPHKVRALAREHLPGHLTPGKFVCLDILPRAPNGKVDRVKLREWAVLDLARDANPPVTETERLLVALWKDAFQVEEVGRSSDFFDLGGDSLIAAVIGAGIHKVTGVELPLGVLLDHPELSALATAIDARRSVSDSEEHPLVAGLADGKAPLTDQQMLFWPRSPMAAQRGTRSTTMWMTGPLDVSAFQSALDDVVARHAMMRTRFVEEAGEPIQVIDPVSSAPLKVIDWSTKDDRGTRLEALRVEERAHAFDFKAGPPLRFVLVRLGPDRHAFIRSSNHIISDALSWPIFFRDLNIAYEARTKGASPSFTPLPVQYADYAVWQSRRLSTATRDNDWWKARIAGADLPADRWLQPYLRRKPSAAASPDDMRQVRAIDAVTASRLDAVATEEGLTYYASRVATTVPVVALIAGCRSALIGGVATRRDRSELLDLFGPFAALTAEIFSYDPAATFRQHLRTIRRQLYETHGASDRPWLSIYQELRADGFAVPPIIVRIQVATPRPQPRLTGLDLAFDDRRQRGVPPHIIIDFDQAHEQHRCRIDFDARIYAPAGMRDLADRIARFAEAAGEAPDETIGRLIESAGVARDLPEPNSL
ncbi:AMP-binding protein [Bauldia sp.]|uniref:AMP-binding protein n=1 Tax=Bauldia sp. TaxID=2575872 RepID=UPI003BAA3794